jgi:hypothetical protein
MDNATLAALGIVIAMALGMVIGWVFHAAYTKPSHPDSLPDSGFLDFMAEDTGTIPPKGTCDRALPSWWCSRAKDHDGPCALRPHFVKPSTDIEGMHAVVEPDRATIHAAGGAYSPCAFCNRALRFPCTSTGEASHCAGPLPTTY